MTPPSKYLSLIIFKICFVIYFIISIFFNNIAYAQSHDIHSIFIMNEQSSINKITGFGVSTLLKDRSSNIGIAIDMSLSKAELQQENHSIKDYVSWELGAKIGYFSDIFIYGEFGFDVAEFLFHDRDEQYSSVYYCENDESFCNSITSSFHENIHYDIHDESNDIDIYIGIGAGINLGHLQLTAYSRYRQVDGTHWSAEGDVYSGVKVALLF